MKRKTFLWLIGMMIVILFVAIYNDKDALEYIHIKDKEYIDQEIGESIPVTHDRIQIYRSLDSIKVVLLERRRILGWKMTEIDRVKFSDGPSWNYVEIKLRDNTVVPLVYGFILDDKANYTPLRLINEADYLDRGPISNVSFKTEIRGWYLFLDKPSKNPEGFELLDFDTGTRIYN